jgi:hypothetical protein
MALYNCPDCGGKVSDLAPSCPHCGRPSGKAGARAPSGKTSNDGGGAKCPHCGMMVTPVVTSVGGGSCSVGRREKWTCPACRKTMHTSGCFVATVAYGDEDQVEVHLLRMFRDQYLLTSRAGQAFVWGYYHLGPYPAWVVTRVPLLRTLARWGLDRVIARIERTTLLSRNAIRDDLSARGGFAASSGGARRSPLTESAATSTWLDCPAASKSLPPR